MVGMVGYPIHLTISLSRVLNRTGVVAAGATGTGPGTATGPGRAVTEGGHRHRSTVSTGGGRRGAAWNICMQERGADGALARLNAKAR